MKQVIIIRSDLDMSIGKSIAQGSHVSVKSALDANESILNKWLDNGGTKIVVKVNSEEKLRKIINEVKSDTEIPASFVEDFGRTEIPKGTLTAGCIGPARNELIDNYTGDLPLYN